MALYQKLMAIVSTLDKEIRDESFLEAREILKQLHNLNLDGGEVYRYLEVYALQFRDNDEPRWEFVCDLLA
jgi:hypothetical protein